MSTGRVRLDGDVVTAPTGKTAKVTLFMLVALGAALIPGLIVAALGFGAAAGLAALAAFGAFLAVMHGGLRTGVAFSAATAIAVGLVAVTASTPWLVALVFFACGLGVGESGRWGRRVAYLELPIVAGFALGDVPNLHHGVWLDALMLAAAIFGAALFGALVMQAFTKQGHHQEPERLTRAQARVHGLVLGVMLAGAAYCVSAFDLAHTGAWVILTFTVIIQPRFDDTWRKALHRAAGTMLGFFISIGVATTIHAPVLLYAAGAIALAFAVVDMVEHKPYWLYATALTVAVVIFEGSSTSILATAQQRLWATTVAAGIALAVMAVLIPFTHRQRQSAL